MVQPSLDLYMFYGMLNIEKLAMYLPFEGDLDHGTQEDKMAYLKSKAVAITCDGWARVFSSRHATVQ